MAQIKNIKKPGDLIRGADVGLAALDKDGNVIGYKAAAADAGKVLTVGEDGSVAPAEGGGDKKYLHNISLSISTNNAKLDFFIMDNSPYKYTTFAQINNYLIENQYNSKDNGLNVSGVYIDGSKIIPYRLYTYDASNIAVDLTSIDGASLSTSVFSSAYVRDTVIEL